jgi:hypothetical protein
MIPNNIASKSFEGLFYTPGLSYGYFSVQIMGNNCLFKKLFYVTHFVLTVWLLSDYFQTIFEHMEGSYVFLLVS